MLNSDSGANRTDEEKTAQAAAKYEATQKDLAQAQAAVSALEKSMKETERTIAHTRKRLPEAMEELKVCCGVRLVAEINCA